MTRNNFYHTSIPLPPREARTPDQRLQAANEAWQDFMTVWNALGAGRNGQSYLPLTAFARFLHELLPDPGICAPLMRHFDALHQQTGGQSDEAHQ